MPKPQPRLTASAITVDAAHATMNNARRNYKRQRELFLKSKATLQVAEATFNQAKETCDQQLIETI